MPHKRLATLNEMLALQEEGDSGRFVGSSVSKPPARSLSLKQRYEQDKRTQQITQAFGKHTK